MRAKSRRILRIFFLIVPVLLMATLFIVYLQPKFVLKWLADRSPDVLYYVNTKTKIVALTIDDAPHPVVTPQLLDVLKEYSAHATFFIIGDHAAGQEQLLERMRSEGHELGNHLAHEYPSIRLSPDEFAGQLREVDQVIGVPTPIKWVRPGSGWYNERMLTQMESQGYRCALGSVYPFDTIVRQPTIISAYITRQIFPGAVIIIHDGKADRTRSVTVLKKILPTLRAQGYQVVTLSELIAITGADLGQPPSDQRNQ